MIDDSALLTPFTPEELENAPTIALYSARPEPQRSKLVVPAKGSGKCWAAEITGLDPRYGFIREFLPPTRVRDGWEFVTQPGTFLEAGWPNGERHYYFVASWGLSRIDRDEVRTTLRCMAKVKA